MTPEGPSMAESDDALYQEFVERYYAAEAPVAVPDDWPETVKARCRFFLQLVLGRSRGFATASVIEALSASGLVADLTLSGPDGAPPPLTFEGDERYAIEGEIARGGMGRILLCYDRDFRRRIAMKVLKDPSDLRSQTARFIEEAQATAQLEHPNIGPVYDLGIDRSGAPYFTMKWIRGRNLDEVLRGGGEEPSLIRLVQILQQVAMGVDFAHSRGVVHRDLKPQNVMVGDFGEVLVMDWGLAKVKGRRTDAAAGDESVTTLRAEQGFETLPGSVQGSLLYMAPEQARGETDRIDSRTDVFGLGAILYTILTRQPLYGEGDLREVLGKARAGEVVPPSRRAPSRDVPHALEEIAERALAPRQEDRFPSARALHDELQAYVEGTREAERRAAEAARLSRAADEKLAELRSREARERELREREAELRGTVEDHDDPAAKEPLWGAIEESRAAGDAVARAFNEATSAYATVLGTDPHHRAARAALAGLYYERLLAAEHRGDREAARLYEGLVAQNRSEGDGFSIEGDEAFSLESEPPGVEVFLSRYIERGVLLVETPRELAGRTPLSLSLPRGSYVALLERAGRVPVRFPFLLERRRGVSARVRLHASGEVPDGFVQVPAGDSIAGGDAGLGAPFPRALRTLEEFFIGRFPVTLEEYCRFLDERFAGEELTESDVESMLPHFGSQTYVAREAEGLFHASSKLGPHVPVMALYPEAIEEYLTWLSGRIGRRARLPTEEEWERAARGADGRIYPWGNLFDWALSHGAPSRGGRRHPDAVGAFPADCSPFGVRDMAGSVRELCARRSGEGEYPVRGGSWFTPIHVVFRADVGYSMPPRYKTTDIGFRVAFNA